MRILQSNRPAYRYRWRWTLTGNLPSHLAATRVAIFEMDPTELYGKLRPAFERMEGLPGSQGPAGHLGLEELRAGASQVGQHIAQELLKQGVDPSARMTELEPLRCLIRDSLAFHTDMPLWMDVFGAWCLHGPERVLHFPMMDLRVPFKPGTFVLFDPAQPHGLLRPGHAEFDPAHCEIPENIAALSVSLPKEGALAALLDCAAVPEDESDLLQTVDQYVPDPRTGNVGLFPAVAQAA